MLDDLYTVLIGHWPSWVSGLCVTIGISAVAIVVGLVLGVALATCLQFGNKVAYWIATVYIETWRNTPLLVQLVLFYFGLPSIGIDLSAVVTAMLVFTLNVSAFFGEILKGGFASVAGKYLESARSLAFTPWQTLRYVILPPAFTVQAEALGSQVILLVLATSQASLISAPELTYNATIVNTETFLTLTTYVVLLVAYFAVSRLLMALVSKINRDVLKSPAKTLVPEL